MRDTLILLILTLIVFVLSKVCLLCLDKLVLRLLFNSFLMCGLDLFIILLLFLIQLESRLIATQMRFLLNQFFFYSFKNLLFLSISRT